MQAGQDAIEGYEFGRFRVLLRQRQLLADGAPVALGGRAFDVLMALIQSCGVVVSKQSLITRVWGSRIIEENNLQSQMTALRKALGADRDLIRTVARRGYQFVAEVQKISGGSASVKAVAAEPVSPSSPTNLPQPVCELVGRDQELSEILNLAAAQRFITLTGAGGIGKTRLAVEAARRLLPKFPGGAWLIDLAPLTDPARVPLVVAAALRLDCPAGAAAVERVAGALGTQPVLLVLDTCEHLIDAAACLVEAVLRANPAATVIATSRELLRAEGEWVYRVPPLAMPHGGADLSQSGAVRLFLARACARHPGFIADEVTATAIAAICRRLDGIPLAIELAAASAATLGVVQLADRPDDLFLLLTGGRRTAAPRHQSLRATLDWSHALLSVTERMVLRRLAIFPGHFSLPAASVVAACGEITASAVVDALADLVAKSLVTSEINSSACYRLPGPTRAYVLGKLHGSGEHEAVAARYAEYSHGLREQSEREQVAVRQAFLLSTGSWAGTVSSPEAVAG
jgi:predicted ATPase/DNA-binding winged helix-turn-helix (wHTH) protein